MSIVDRVEQVLNGLNPAYLYIRDFSGGCDGAKLDVYIVLEKFGTMKLLERHRFIQDLISGKGYMSEIHALTIKAWTPEEYEKKKATIPAH